MAGRTVTYTCNRGQDFKELLGRRGPASKFRTLAWSFPKSELKREFTSELTESSDKNFGFSAGVTGSAGSGTSVVAISGKVDSGRSLNRILGAELITGACVLTGTLIFTGVIWGVLIFGGDIFGALILGADILGAVILGAVIFGVLRSEITCSELFSKSACSPSVWIELSNN